MIFSILLAVSGLTLSGVAIYYSVIGLTAIFAAAYWPTVVMGTTLEVSKLVAASWLKAHWSRIPVLMKVYMSLAVVILMFITSMGIFGFLSKAHGDQNLISGDVQSKIAIYDEKIKTAKDNIDANRKALKQMDEAVDQVMARSSSETGADKAVGIRRSQQKERARLQSDIQAEQKAIATLSEARNPIAAEVRKVEAEVGPIKYIAKLIYGDNPDTNLLEKSVTWVIMIIVAVFDPLAVLMLLASQMAWQWYKKDQEAEEFDSDNYWQEQADELNDAFAEELKTATIVEPVVQPTVEEVAVPAPEPDVIMPEARAVEPTEPLGTEFPADPTIGQEFTRLDFDPARAFVFNGEQWVDAVHSEKTYIIKKDNQQFNESYVQNSEQQESGLWKTIKAKSNE